MGLLVDSLRVIQTLVDSAIPIHALAGTSGCRRRLVSKIERCLTLGAHGFCDIVRTFEARMAALRAREQAPEMLELVPPVLHISD